MDARIIAAYCGLIISGFLLGGVMFSRLLPLMIKKRDVSDVSDDGNPGSVNVFVNFGVPLGIVCCLLDILKGFLPVFVAIKRLPIENFLFSLVMFAPVAGHAVGVFNGFRGGKCIATAFGVAIATLFISPVGFILAGTYIVTAIVFAKNHTVASLVTFSVFFVAALAVSIIIGQPFTGIGFAMISAAAIVKHLPRFAAKPAEKTIESDAA